MIFHCQVCGQFPPFDPFHKHRNHRSANHAHVIVIYVPANARARVSPCGDQVGKDEPNAGGAVHAPFLASAPAFNITLKPQEILQPTRELMQSRYPPPLGATVDPSSRVGDTSRAWCIASLVFCTLCRGKECSACCIDRRRFGCENKTGRA